MAISKLVPNIIHLGGPVVEIGDIAASEAITPGHLCERFNNAGVWRMRKHATAAADTPRLVANAQFMRNQTVSDAYAANDLVEAFVAEPGATAWMLLASGQTIVFGDKLESNGDGSLRKIGSGTALFTAQESKTTAGSTTTRCRVEAL